MNTLYVIISVSPRSRVHYVLLTVLLLNIQCAAESIFYHEISLGNDTINKGRNYILYKHKIFVQEVRAGFTTTLQNQNRIGSDPSPTSNCDTQLSINSIFLDQICYFCTLYKVFQFLSPKTVCPKWILFPPLDVKGV